MDMGFGGVLEKLDEYVGRSLTRLVLFAFCILIITATVAAVIGIVHQLSEIRQEPAIWRLVVGSIGQLLLYFTIAWAAVAYAKYRVSQHYDRLQEYSSILVERSESAHRHMTKALETYQKAAAMREEARAVLNAGSERTVVN